MTPTLTPIRSQPIPNFCGPQGQKVIVAIGWHVDAESSVIAGDPLAKDHLTALSEGAYGVSTAIPRILKMHEELDIPATFFVPGYVADLHPEEIGAIASAGHELAHHGYMHENCFHLDTATQKEVFVKGIDALQRITGKAPLGWSAPTWGVKPDTLELLCDLGFLYDCSLMEYDTPYQLLTPKGTLLELPISMVLDDWQIFGASPHPGGGVNATAANAYQIWQEEFEGMCRFGGFFSTTFHPNLMGRPGRLNMLYQLFEMMKSRSDIWWATCEEVALYARTLVRTE
ncbi:MAG: polysaccharide deacetylase [Cyanobacteria bacterium J06648_11]